MNHLYLMPSAQTYLVAVMHHLKKNDNGMTMSWFKGIDQLNSKEMPRVLSNRKTCHRCFLEGVLCFYTESQIR